jgi:predicted oxidoreductase
MRIMKRMKLGTSTLEVSRIALGCMRLSDDRKQAMRTVQAALDQGIDFFDHADIYGRGERERVFSALWGRAPSLRDQIIVQSKCGIRLSGDPQPTSPGRYDFSSEHIVRSVEGSLRRLETDYLDVLLLHRPDALVEQEEVARAFDRLYHTGKVRWFGVSNHTAAQIRLLQTCVDQPLVANQVQLSVVHNQLINDGVVFNRDDVGVMSRSEGAVEFCRMEGITIQAWSPLAGGRVSGSPITPLNARLGETAAVVAELAEARSVSKEAILIAWLLRHPARIQPIIGTTNPVRIAGACQAEDLELTREEWYLLFTAGRGGPVP